MNKVIKKKKESVILKIRSGKMGPLWRPGRRSRSGRAGEGKT